ncbi:MAG TPA: Flp family type IVb pilin, partial [Stellaceae bacterium]|nr:Flp family type IVb pilin [Stellaceae bacterium]
MRQLFRIGNSPTQQLEATLQRTLIKFFADESGATAIEYGLIAAGIALAIIAVVNGLGSNLNGMFTSINS